MIRLEFSRTSSGPLPPPVCKGQSFDTFVSDIRRDVRAARPWQRSIAITKSKFPGHRAMSAVTVALGHTQLSCDEARALGCGSVALLDVLDGDPVDVFADGLLIARGELVVIEQRFCVRVVELVAAAAA